ncbi:Mobile element protein [Methanosarcina barkeri MS]|uniref:Mobile element protein n=1 Tax=Methanosarcina barkeri MS TaxID=1434108 RepID=A0A0E3QYN6_METBA|nr:Mobile element protein [Methanosarcina barkeri MS]
MEERSTSLEDLNVQVHVWLERVNSTVHGTTYQILLERFKEEKLNPLGKVPPYKV